MTHTYIGKELNANKSILLARKDIVINIVIGIVIVIVIGIAIEIAILRIYHVSR